MTPLRRFSPSQLAALALAGLAGLGVGRALDDDGPQAIEVRGFALEHEVLVPGAPEAVFDAFTGDVRGWWDHSFSEEPHALFIEPRAGGGFYEHFDEHGNGALHAQVTLAERGRELVFRGPLGFGRLGVHFDMVHRFTFEAEGDQTRLRVTVHGVGEIEEGWDAAVQGVWRHFLDERFAPYVRGDLR